MSALAALASDAGLSRYHFCRAFKESTRMSPHAWLRQHQLDRAMNMLRDTNDSIVSIAAALGYSSQAAFAAAFKKLTGESPSDWRRRHGLNISFADARLVKASARSYELCTC